MADVESPGVLRLRWIRDVFEPWCRGYFAARPKRNSLLLAVAQYWSDEANDAVHAVLIASNHDVPRWPMPSPYGNPKPGPDDDAHVSMWRDEDGLKPLPWGENVAAVRPFQACCGEFGNQERPQEEQYLPVLLARREGVTFIGDVRRPWLDLPQAELPIRIQDDVPPPPIPACCEVAEGDLEALEAISSNPLDDGPRRVWADACLERQDPRGEFGARREPPIDALLSRGDFFLGDLNRVVPLGTAQFRYGSLASATAYFDQSTIALADSLWWLTVHTLRFATQGQQWLSNTMTGVRHLAGLDGPAIEQLAKWKTTPMLRSLQVAVRTEFELRELLAAPLHNLESLTIVGADYTRDFVPPWKQLERVCVLDVSVPLVEFDVDAVLPSTGLKLRDVTIPVRHLSVGLCGEGQVEEGWRLDFDRERPTHAQLRHERLGPRSSLAQRDALLEGLPDSVTTLELIPSQVWSGEPFKHRELSVLRLPTPPRGP